MSKTPNWSLLPFVLLGLAVGLVLSAIQLSLLLSAGVGALLALPLASRVAFRGLWANLGVLRAALTGRSNLPAAMVRAMFLGAALNGFVVAAVGHLLGQVVIWPSVGLDQPPVDFGQVIAAGSIGFIGNLIYKLQRKSAL